MIFDNIFGPQIMGCLWSKKDPEIYYDQIYPFRPPVKYLKKSPKKRKVFRTIYCTKCKTKYSWDCNNNKRFRCCSIIGAKTDKLIKEKDDVEMDWHPSERKFYLSQACLDRREEENRKAEQLKQNLLEIQRQASERSWAEIRNQSGPGWQAYQEQKKSIEELEAKRKAERDKWAKIEQANQIRNCFYRNCKAQINKNRSYCNDHAETCKWCDEPTSKQVMRRRSEYCTFCKHNHEEECNGEKEIIERFHTEHEERKVVYSYGKQVYNNTSPVYNTFTQTKKVRCGCRMPITFPCPHEAYGY